ncbi:glycoside hydrolase family 95 protein, partial [Candidatus Bathyarchaeota archaeon]|nr:glycoside hydrolase family 95 protein [Candidatus Bathyarchaeota archaeon]
MSLGNLKIWYESPASVWVEALPLGNGTLGAMVFGWIEEECFQLNNDTLWSGFPRDRTNPSALELLPSVQKLVLDGKIPEAERVIEQHMGCPRTESYQPMGYLYLALDHGKNVTHYRRELDLETATCKVEYNVAGGAHVTREAFISYPDKVMVVKITAEGGSPLTLEASLDTDHERSCTIQQKDDGGDYLVLESRVPSHVAPNYEITHGKEPVTYEDGKGMPFQIHLKILNCDGMVAIEGDAIAISNARSIELLIASGTSFSGFNVDPSNQPVRLEDRAQEIISGKGDVSYQGLKSRHIKDYQELFSRVTLDLGTSENMALPTGNRISQIKVSKQVRKMDDPVFKWFMQAA